MNRIVCLVLAVILSAACSLKEIDAPEYVNESGESVFYAEIESPAESTKAYADASLKVLWDADDRVSIFNKDTYNQQYVFNGQTGDNAGGFDIVQSGGFVTANDIAHVYAVYPYNASTKISNDEVLTLNLPARQTWREGTFGKGASTMIAVSSGNKLKFKNLPSYLAVRLYGDDVRVSSVELQGNNGESLSGECTVTMSEGGVPQVTMNTEGSGIIVECDSPVLIGDSQNNYTEFWFALPPTNFRAGFTVTVTVDDGGKFTKTTEKTINLQRNIVSRMVPFEVKTVPVPEAIDLGLSVKWASFNVGASKPEEYGDYYAWGEIETKESYIWPTNKWSNGDSERLIKYCTDASCWDGSGQMDYKTILDIEDDVANLLLGDNWRMASLDEWIELQDNCTWTWTNNYKGTGVAGRIGTSNKEGYTDKTIFLPAAGGRDGVLSNVGKDCNFWSSTLARDHSYNACGFMLNESGICSYNYYRYAGLSIRAVNGEVVPVSCISVPAAMDLYLGKTETITATVLPADATYGNLTWTSSDESVVKVDNSGQVTAVSVGRATITVYSADASKTAECEVTVSP
ncbi:MAG: Ig-like domain-containing protein, partial [Bacteroidales bacterium]|nr:Ig-like domain-containing protein [Bacteroidales bacterium]